MNSSRFTTLTRIGLFSLILSLAPMAGIAYGQTANDTVTPVTTQTQDDGFDWGWLGLAGLIGLAGLAGLGGRKRDDHVHRDDTVRRTDHV